MKTIIILTLFISFNVMALTPEAENGKAAIAACMSCHNAELNPALAPPFYGVQNKYKQAFADKQVFIQAISDWAKKPSFENSLMKRPVKMLGLMPAMPLPDDMLANIGAYLFEENFSPPCTHWAHEINKTNSQASGKGQSQGRGNGKGNGHGNRQSNGQGSNHAAMIKMKYDQLCK